jgi:hypothetical protein
MRYTAFARWRKRSSLINAEERVLLLKEQKLVARSWETWRTATCVTLAIYSVTSLIDRSQRKTALELFERHSVARALSKWKSTLTRIQVSPHEWAVLTIQSLDHQAADMRAKGDRVIQRQAFGTWIASERSKLLAQVHDTRVTRDCLSRWQNKRKSLQALEGRSQHTSRQQLIDSICR